VNLDDKVVVGRIVDLKPHPRADKLSVSKVDVGLSMPLNIVCGAGNIKAGDIVPVVLPGGRVASPQGKMVKVRRVRIRGIESAGMMCSPLELGISKDHDNIFILPQSLGDKIGRPLSRFSLQIGLVKKNEARGGKRSLPAKETLCYQLMDYIYQAGLKAGINKSLLRLNEIVVEHPADAGHGDYATSIALVLAKRLKKNPLEIANLFKEELEKTPELKKVVFKVETAPPGFVNFWLSKEFLLDRAKEIAEKDGFLAKLKKIGQGKTVVIDYSSPNIARPFGIGHLRSTNIGQVIYNLYQILGWKTVGDNHLGDWGTQFGKLIVAIKKWGPRSLKKLTVAELEKLYVRFHKEAKKDPKLEEEGRVWFKRLEEGDPEAKEIWQFCVDVSLTEFNRVYQLLGVRIDHAYGEAFYHFEGWMEKVLTDVKKKSLLKESRGALVIDISGLKTPGMLVKSDGATTYLLRDLATIKFRVEKWHPDLIVYEVGKEQKLHFQQVFYIAEKLGYISQDKLIHIGHGLIRWPHGKFSTRKGDTVHLEEIVNQGIERARKLVEASQTSKDLSQEEKERIARAVGIGGIKFNDLKQEPQRDIIFDWDKILTIEGYSAPYLQYTYARCFSVLKKAKKKPRAGADKVSKEELSLLRTFYQFPEVIIASGSEFSPHILCQYLFDLAQKFNLFYQKQRILGSEFRLFLARTTAAVLKLGLEVLGIEALSKM